MAIANASAGQLITMRTRLYEMETLLNQLLQKRNTATTIDTAEVTALGTAVTNLKSAVDAVAAA